MNGFVNDAVDGPFDAQLTKTSALDLMVWILFTHLLVPPAMGPVVTDFFMYGFPLLA